MFKIWVVVNLLKKFHGHIKKIESGENPLLKNPPRKNYHGKLPPRRKSDKKKLAENKILLEKVPSS